MKANLWVKRRICPQTACWTRPGKSQGKPHIKAPTTARGEELAKQINLEDNEILSKHPPQVKARFWRLVNTYETVFTDEDVAISHTDIVKMNIKLTKQAVPVRALVCHV